MPSIRTPRAYRAAGRLPNADSSTYLLEMRDRDEALAALLRRLKDCGYGFVTVTPATHGCVFARKVETITLRDVFGWSRAFRLSDLPNDIVELMRDGDILEHDNGRFVSAVRVASLDGDLFLHSRYPTNSSDAVFFGPDTYRFVSFVKRHLPAEARSIVDLGAGSGAAGIVAKRMVPGAAVTLVDVNQAALDLARVNAGVAAVQVQFAEAIADARGPDLIIANPPYIMDQAGRAYRDGGELLGGQAALEWAADALDALQSGGTALLYTGAAFQNGRSPLVDALERLCLDAGAAAQLEEIDPDVFGDELRQPAYSQVERIAVVGAVIHKRR
jgi:methylase of polypeptide subunit release factors